MNRNDIEIENYRDSGKNATIFLSNVVRMSKFSKKSTEQREEKLKKIRENKESGENILK